MKHDHEREREAIRELFRDQRVFVRPGRVIRTPVNAMYSLDLRPGEKIKKVRDRIPEIALLLSNIRGRETSVRLVEAPLYLDVPHAYPETLPWASDGHYMPHHCVAGRGWSYRGGADQVVNLTKEPHILVSGITGSGKSVMVLNLVLSLAMGTSPEDLAIVLVDLKNDDLVGLKTLPHVVRFAGSPEDADNAIEWVYSQLESRRDSSRRPSFRIALVIDELAQLSSGSKETLSRITALGRSMWINVISATQYPTADVLGGSTGKVNYTVRFTGLLPDAQTASTAAGRPGTGAEKLPGNGAFIRTGGPDVIRLQSFYIDTDVAEEEEIVKDVSYRWIGKRPSVEAQRAAESEDIRIPVSGKGPTLSDVGAVPDAVQERLYAYFEEYYDGEGGLERGSIAEAIRIATGEDVKRGRGYSDQKAVVMRELQEWLTQEDERTWEYVSEDVSRTFPDSV